MNRSGHTLVEVMVASFLSFIIIGMIMSTFSFFSRTAGSSNKYNNIHNELRHAINIIEKDVHSSASISTSVGGPTELKLITSTGSVIVRYYLSGEELHKVVSGADYILAEHIKSVDFTASGSKVTITLLAEDTNLSAVISDSVQTTIYMRNSN